MKNSLLLSIVSLFACILPAPAITRTWDGGGGTAAFNNAANWNPDGVPANGDDLVFPAAAPDTVSNDLTSRTFASLSFPAGTTIAGNSFTLTGGITTSAGGIRGAVTIEPAVTLGANQSFTCNGSGVLTFAGSVIFGARTLTVTGVSTCVFNGLTGSSTAGSRLIKSGTGTLRVGPSAIAFTNQPWDVGEGTLDVDGNLQAPVNLTGGKLMGGGVIIGLNATGGEVEPDDSGLSVTGSAVLGGSSRCSFHLQGASDENTLECSGGSVTIQDGATMTVDAAGYTPVKGEVFQLITKSTVGPITGRFSNVADDAEVQVASGTFSRAHYDGGNGNDLTLDVFSIVRTWDGGHTINDNWDEADNWSGNIAPGSGDALHFPAGIQSSDRGLDNNFPNDTTFRELRFFAGDYTVRGNRLRLTKGFALQAISASGQINMDTDVALADTASILFPEDSAGLNTTLHFDLLDKLDLAGQTLLIGGAGKLEARLAGAGMVQFVNGANIILSGSGAGRSDYSADTHIGIGARVVLDPNQSMGSTAGRTIVSGSNQNRAVLQVNVTSFDLNFAFDEPVQLNQGELFCSGSDDTAAFTLNSTITMAGVGFVRQSNAHGAKFYELKGLIQSLGPLRLTGHWHFTGDINNTFTGTTDVEKYGNDPTFLKLDRRNGARCLTGTALNIHDECTVELLRDDQIAAAAAVTVKDGGLLNLGDFHQTLGSARVEGTGKINGTDSALLDIGGPVTADATGGTPFITAPLRLTANSILTASGAEETDLVISRPVTRSGGAQSFSREGPGVVEFGGAFNVPAFLKDGITVFNGAGGTSSGIIMQGGALRGRGSVDSITFQTGGEVAPGEDDTRGTLTCRRFVMSAGTGTLRLRLGHTTGSDQLRVLESCQITGLGLDSPVTGSPPPGHVFTLIRNDGPQPVNGTFTGLAQDGIVQINGLDYRINYEGGDGNDVTLTRGTPPVEVRPVVTSVTIGAADGNGNRPVSIAGKGTPGASYLLESSVDLFPIATWVPEGAAQTANATTGALSFTTSASPSTRLKQFWRFRRL